MVCEENEIYDPPIRKARALRQSQWREGWTRTKSGWERNIEYPPEPEPSDATIALDRVYYLIESLEKLAHKHWKNYRAFQVGRFRRSAVGRELAKFFMQPASRVGQKKSVVSKKNNRTPFKLWIYGRYNTKRNEHEQKNRVQPKYSFEQFRTDLMNERSKESRKYFELLRPKGRFIGAEALRQIVNRVASSQVLQFPRNSA